MVMSSKACTWFSTYALPSFALTTEPASKVITSPLLLIVITLLLSIPTLLAKLKVPGTTTCSPSIIILRSKDTVPPLPLELSLTSAISLSFNLVILLLTYPTASCNCSCVAA